MSFFVISVLLGALGQVFGAPRAQLRAQAAVALVAAGILMAGFFGIAAAGAPAQAFDDARLLTSLFVGLLGLAGIAALLCACVGVAAGEASERNRPSGVLRSVGAGAVRLPGLLLAYLILAVPVVAAYYAYAAFVGIWPGSLATALLLLAGLLALSLLLLAWLGPLFALALPVSVAEGRGGWGAIARSHELASFARRDLLWTLLAAIPLLLLVRLLFGGLVGALEVLAGAAPAGIGVPAAVAAVLGAFAGALVVFALLTALTHRAYRELRDDEPKIPLRRV